MHEWSLAESVILSIKNKKKATVKIGELQQIDREIFEFALRELAKLQGVKAKINIQIEKGALLCRNCEHSWNFSNNELNKEDAESIHFIPEVAHAYINCPKCKSHDFEIIKGRGVWIQD